LVCDLVFRTQCILVHLAVQFGTENMHVEAYFRSLTAELEALRDRVRSFMDKPNWLTDGEWKESVLRSVLTRQLPETIKVGRGFVLTKNGNSTQCDILIYKASAPVLFRDGDLVFLTPDAVVGIIEVKSRVGGALVTDVIGKFSEIGRKMSRHRKNCIFGLFSYQADIDGPEALTLVHEGCRQRSGIVDIMTLGCSDFVKWWPRNPRGGEGHYDRWHSYELQNMSAGYFIANVVESVSPGFVAANNELWFPEAGKEARKTGETPFDKVPD
jgi:hypothetical protein